MNILQNENQKMKIIRWSNQINFGYQFNNEHSMNELMISFLYKIQPLK